MFVNMQNISNNIHRMTQLFGIEPVNRTLKCDINRIFSAYGIDEPCNDIGLRTTLQKITFETSTTYLREALLNEFINIFNWMSSKPLDGNDKANSNLHESEQSSPNTSSQQSLANAATNLCIVCSTRYRALAFVPCGHFAVCVPCGHGLKLCPTCGTNIKAFLRVYD